MALYFQIALLISTLLYTGCSTTQPSAVEHKEPATTPLKSNDSTASQEISAFRKNLKTEEEQKIPALVLPPAYENISVFNEHKITFSAQAAKLSTVLHSISQIAGLNLIIDKEIDTNQPISISVNEVDLQDALNIIMNMSGTYYKLNGNILYIKEFMNRSFSIPYIHTTSSFKTDLGGDVLSSTSSGDTSSGSGVKGTYALKFDNPNKINSFYDQLEANIKTLVSKEGHYTLNRFTGTLNVYDRKKSLDNIAQFIKKIKTQATKQVLIEAKILEVSLNKSHQLGVSWEAVANSLIQTGDALTFSQPLALSGSVAGTAKYTSQNFTSIINALNEDGDVDTLSNPRIKVLSGQSAIISSGKLVPFWEKEVQTTQGTGGSASNTEVSYTRRDILDGLTMGVTPTILENGNIMLNVTPITSRIEKTVDNVDETGAVVGSAPVINIKETGTIVQAKDNTLVLIGGLINNSVVSSEKKVPLLGYIPYIGALFTQEISTNVKKELVILIRLKVIK